MLGDERGSDLRIAWTSGDGHGVRVVGLEVGAGPSVGGFVGIEGRASFGCVGGDMRARPADGLFATPADGARSAASLAETGAGELLVPV